MNLKDVELPYGQEIRTGTSDSILAALYRSILYDIGIDESRFIAQVARYVKRVTPQEDQAEISSIRANARNELMKSSMTWKVFVKGLRVLNIRKVTVGIDLTINDEGATQVAVKRSLILDPTFPKEASDLDQLELFISTLFHDILFQMSINTRRFNELIRDYIVRAKIPTNLKQVSNTRGSLKKELTKPKMSWKVFNKGLLFLNVRSFNLGVQLYHTNGKITTHYRSIKLGTSGDE